MALRELRVSGYRSVRDLRVQLGPVNIIVGPNGCGKSNLYRAIWLLAESIQGRLASALAREGGLPSAFWAGSRKRGPAQMKLAIREDDFAYELICGLPGQDPGSPTYFKLDPEVKEESLDVIAPSVSKVSMLQRNGRAVHVRDRDGRKVLYPLSLADNESAVSQIRDPQRYPELTALRDLIQQWRFYHHFRTDSTSPIRQPQVGVRTMILGHDGHDLAAALQTIIEFGDAKALMTTFGEAFPNTTLRVDRDEAGRFEVRIRPAGIQRWLDAREVSDGTLRFLCLLAALLSPSPPALLAFNEPETSLHPDLIQPLARQIAAAGKRSQLWITTHSKSLAASIASASGQRPIELVLTDGETQMANGTALGLLKEA